MYGNDTFTKQLFLFYLKRYIYIFVLSKFYLHSIQLLRLKKRTFLDNEPKFLLQWNAR